MAGHAVPAGVSIPPGAVFATLTNNLVTAINVARHSAGRSTLALVTYPLCRAALEHAVWMAHNGDCSHGDGNNSFATRMNNFGITSPRAENVAYTTHTNVNQVTAQWVGSAGHLQNIINPAFTRIGVGVAVGTNFTYWCTVFN